MVVSAPPDACSSYETEGRKGYLGTKIEKDREEDKIN